jgi:hypothetical protein
MTLSYATDGKCHNANVGTFNHECGQPATWVGTKKTSGFMSGFCDHCKEHGDEAKAYSSWKRIKPEAAEPLSTYAFMDGTKFSNPRMSAVIENWPSGKHRVTAKFSIETDLKRGQRAVRITTGEPKKLTYARLMRIVDGDDGRTYIAALTEFGHITIHRGDMKYAECTVFPRDAAYPAFLALFGELLMKPEIER